MKQVQITELTPKALLALIKKGENVVLFDGGEPVAQLLVSAAELARRKDFFKFYPHDPTECFGTCWRHDGKADAEQPAAEDNPVPVGV